MFLGVEHVSGVPGAVALGIFGGVSSLVSLLGPGDIVHSICGAVAYVFLGLVSIGYSMYVPN